MNVLGEVTVGAAAESRAIAHAYDEYVCWTRMQAEAGQQLDSIIARKELERRAGNGDFLWGVGNSPAVITRTLARAVVPVRVVFSIMKSRPRPADVAPSRTLIWRRYVDVNGAERPLPAYALVTSRGDHAGGAKRAHYALMCHSAEPLKIHRGAPFDPAAFRNAGGTGAPVGASQVTALLRRVAKDSLSSSYEANITAWLAGSYWVRLTDPMEMGADRLALLGMAAQRGVDEWCDTVAAIRSGPPAKNDTQLGALL